MNENKENNELKTDFYEILGVSKNASLDEMKKKYKKLTTDDIDQYEVQYIGSKEEEKDILFFYEKCRGDMSQMIEYIPFSSSLHIIRYKEFIDKCLEEKKLEKYEKFVKDSENG